MPHFWPKSLIIHNSSVYTGDVTKTAVLNEAAACCSQLHHVTSRCVNPEWNIQLPLAAVRFLTTWRGFELFKMAPLHEMSYLLQIKMCDKAVLCRALVLFALSQLATAKWNSFDEGWWNGGVAKGWGLHEMQLSSGCKNEGSLNTRRSGSYALENGRLHMWYSSPHTCTAFPVLQLTSHCVFVVTLSSRYSAQHLALGGSTRVSSEEVFNS